MTIFEEVTQIVTDRLCQYDIVLADFYFLASRMGDHQLQQEIWEEAWANGNTSLLALLLLTETPLYEMM